MAIEEGVWPVIVFPNLSLVWQDVRVVYPLTPDASILTHTPAMLNGVPDAVNSERVLVNTNAYGPAGVVGADDIEAYEMCQLGYHASAPEWTVLSRGMDRERRDENGWLVGQASDDTGLRAYWQGYLDVMSAPRPDRA